ncbi:MAG: long-chain fatty acid--CoA ligase [Bdellovibrionales bacterium]|nr:long-chain fatty acid--CoA ligase [Bdellovibrionales bacterium]
MAVNLDSFSSIPAAFFSMVEHYADETVYSYAVLSESEDLAQPRKWIQVSNATMGERVRKLAAYLRSCGVRKGSKVAIISQSRPEWMESDLAITALGAISISVYQTLPAEDIGYILFDSDAEVVIAENQEQLDKLKQLMSGPCHIPGHEEREEQQVHLSFKRIICMEQVEAHELVYQYARIMESQEDVPCPEFLELTRDDYASFVYTSGTTGPPKGVMQTHGNHLANARQVMNAKLVDAESTIMVFLPLAHSFAKLMGILGVTSETKLKFPAVPDKSTSQLNPASVTKDIREGSGTHLPIVPRLLEKMQSGLVAKSKGGGIGGALLRLTLWGAKTHYAASTKGLSPGILASIAYQGTSGIRAKVKEKLFGPHFSFAISGGAKLNPNTAIFFDALGIDIVEGYGLTETCVATNVNRKDSKKIGTVGPVLDVDVELKIETDGEICFRGPNVTKGYYKRDTATKASWDSDGWFHTGDLGEVDSEGYLSIVGRKKDILVTSYGKNVAPEDIEARVKSSHELISQVVMLGDGRPFCIMLVTLDPGATEAWCRAHSITDEPNHESKAVYDSVWKAVQNVNKDLASYESIKKISIVAEDFTVENGMLTPTFKVKRKVVTDKYADLISKIYGAE